MTLREFDDERGRAWTVWDVHPTSVDRRQRNVGPPAGIGERRGHTGSRAIIAPRLAQGWLAFEARDGERRRLAPIPDVPRGWPTASDGELREWCELAQPVPPPRRPSE